MTKAKLHRVKLIKVLLVLFVLAGLGYGIHWVSYPKNAQAAIKFLNALGQAHKEAQEMTHDF